MIGLKSKIIWSALILSAAAVILSACGQAATPMPTPDMSAYSTAAVLTVEARYTQTAAAIPTETPEPEPTYTPFSLDGYDDSFESDFDNNFSSGADLYPEDFTPETVYYSSENDFAAAAVPTAVSGEAAVNKAIWQSQTPADNSHVPAGSEFTITWNLLNSGTTTWTTDYSLRYYTGTNLTKPGKRYTLSSPVAPNTVGACSLEAVAPWNPGTYQMSVVLSDEEDRNFSVVDITIVVD